MTIHVVGNSKGLGAYLYERYTVEFPKTELRGYSRNNGYDISKDIIKICYQVEPNDLVILNAHASGNQIYYLKELKNIRDLQVVVMGSIASTFIDTTMLDYSKEKQQLEKYFEETVLEGHKWLYLKLTGKSYKDYQLIWNTIQFWNKNPEITQIGFNV